MENEAAAAEADGSPEPPTAEATAGRQVRMLRQGHGWSQQEAANRMRPFGYNWGQSTIGKIEAAQRPLRLNELADLAVMFGVPVTHFLRPDPAPDDGTDLDAVEHEIRVLLQDRLTAAERAGQAEDARRAADHRFHIAADTVHRIDSRLQTLQLWHPKYDEIARTTLEELAAAAAPGHARAHAPAWKRNEDTEGPERTRELFSEALLRPFAELLSENQMGRIRAVFREAVRAAMDDPEQVP